MQDKDLFNGVIGKYTDRNDENGATKKNNDAEIASVAKPGKLINVKYGDINGTLTFKPPSNHISMYDIINMYYMS